MLMGAVIVSQSVLSLSDYAPLLDRDVHTVYSICGKLLSGLDFGTVLRDMRPSSTSLLQEKDPRIYAFVLTQMTGINYSQSRRSAL